MIAKRTYGTGRIFLRGTTWWAQYYHNGKQVRVTTKETDPKAAERFLIGKIGAKNEGKAPAPSTARIKYENLREALLADYRANGRKWLRQGKDGKPYIVGLSNLDPYFEGWKALEITTDAIRAFTRKRQDEGAANGTINRELALLRRMLRLAVEDEKLRYVPHLPMLKEAPPRKGFVEYEAFQNVRKELPEYLRTVATVAFSTGMRVGEILGLRWENIVFLDSQIRLDPGATKNDDARLIPLTGELLEMLKIERQKHPKSEHVFIRDGQPIKSFYKAWDSACERAGVPELLFHDMRRSSLRNYVRADVPEKVAMQITGHRTRSVFDRYNIVSDRDLKDAASKLEDYLARKNGDKTGTISESGQGQAEVITDQVTKVQ